MIERMKLTDALVRKLEAPEAGTPEFRKGYVLVADADSPLRVRVTNAGVRSFIVEYRIRRRERSYTIGRCDVWDLRAARDEAKRIVRQAHDGADPLADRDAPTVEKLARKFTEEVLPSLRPTTQADYRLIVEREILPALGKLRVTDVTLQDIERLHRKISERAPYQANRVAAVVSALFAKAIRWKMAKENPARGLERNPEHSRARYLANGETSRLLEALDRYRDQTVADLLRVMLYTGCRRGEAMTMKWADIVDGTWSKPYSATKQKRAHIVPLSPAVQVILARQPRTGELVFPSTTTEWRGRIRRAWDAITRDAKIEGLRLHDLRHSFASTLVNAGLSLSVIGGMLGHSRVTTTSRYAHLFKGTLQSAADRAAELIDAERNPSASVTPLKRGA